MNGQAASALIGIILSAATAQGQGWPQLLSPQMSGAADDPAVATSFPGNKPPLVWHATVGFGSAPVVVADGKVYGVGLYKPGTGPRDLDEPASTPTLDAIAPETFPSGELPGTAARVKTDDYPLAYRGGLYARCFDAATGRPLWATRLTDHGLAFKTNKHGGSGWEVASPLVAGGRLFVHTHTHTGRLFALDAANGVLDWGRNLFDHRMSTWFGGQQGNSSAPVPSGDAIFVS